MPVPPPPAHGPPPAHEPAAAAGPVRRAAAWAVDFALMLLVAAPLASWTWTRIGTLIKDVPALAERGVWEVVGSGGDVQAASARFGQSIWGSVSAYVAQAFAALVLVVFAYHFASLAWKGRTLGKLLFDLRVEPVRVEPVHAGTVLVEGGGRARLGVAPALGRATARTVTDIGLYAIACCLLLQGMFLLAVLCWLLAVAAYWVNAVPVLLPARRALHDRVLGTRVVRANLYRTAAQQAVQGGRVAAQYAAQGGRGAAEKGREALEKAKQNYNERRGRTQPPPPPALGPPQPPPLPFPQPEGHRIPRPEDQ